VSKANKVLHHQVLIVRNCSYVGSSRHGLNRVRGQRFCDDNITKKAWKTKNFGRNFRTSGNDFFPTIHFLKRLSRNVGIIGRTEKELRVTNRCQFHQCFYVQIFRTNVVSAAFSHYVVALAPKFRTKNVCVNFDEIDGRSTTTFHFHRIYILRAGFQYC